MKEDLPDNYSETVFTMLRLTDTLPKDCQLRALATAFLVVADRELSTGFAAGEFRQVQARQLRLLGNVRRFVDGEPDLDLLNQSAELERAIEDAPDSLKSRDCWKSLRSGCKSHRRPTKRIDALDCPQRPLCFNEAESIARRGSEMAGQS